MSAITLGYPELERRLAGIRRRLNRLSAQDSACVAGSAVLLTASAVIVATVIKNEVLFQLTFWSLAAGLPLLLAVVGVHLYQRWLSLEQTARLVDRRAGMEDRLATLICQRDEHPRPRLRNILLSQIFQRLPQWDIDRVAPRRLPRSAAAFLLSFLVFIGALSLDPSNPQPPPAGAVAPELSSSLGASNESDAARDSARLAAAFGSNAASGHAAPHAPETAEGTQRSRGSSHAAPGDTSGQQGLTKRLRDRVERALDGTSTARAGREKRSENRKARAGRGGAQAQSSPHPGSGNGPAAAARQHPAPATTPRAQSGPRKGAPSSAESETAKGRRAGGGKGSRAGGLFGEAPRATTGSAAAPQPLRIELTSLSVVAARRFEPQSDLSRPDADTAQEPEPAAGNTAITGEQQPDRALLKVAVPAPYEALVRRLFSNGKVRLPR